MNNPDNGDCPYKYHSLPASHPLVVSIAFSMVGKRKTSSISSLNILRYGRVRNIFKTSHIREMKLCCI